MPIWPSRIHCALALPTFYDKMRASERFHEMPLPPCEYDDIDDPILETLQELAESPNEIVQDAESPNETLPDAESPKKKRPRGRPPKGFVWDDAAGRYTKKQRAK